MKTPVQLIEEWAALKMHTEQLPPSGSKYDAFCDEVQSLEQMLQAGITQLDGEAVDVRGMIADRQSILHRMKKVVPC